jgi:hypothetical protein
MKLERMSSWRTPQNGKTLTMKKKTLRKTSKMVERYSF